MLSGEQLKLAMERAQEQAMRRRGPARSISILKAQCCKAAMWSTPGTPYAYETVADRAHEWEIMAEVPFWPSPGDPPQDYEIRRRR